MTSVDPNLCMIEPAEHSAEQKQDVDDSDDLEEGGGAGASKKGKKRKSKSPLPDHDASDEPRSSQVEPVVRSRL